MLDALVGATGNVIQVWGLMPDESMKIIAQVQKLIRQGRATDVSAVQHGAYISVYDRFGAPYTVGREQGLLHLLGPGGETIAIGKTLDVISHSLDTTLKRYE